MDCDDCARVLIEKDIYQIFIRNLRYGKSKVDNEKTGTQLEIDTVDANDIDLDDSEIPNNTCFSFTNRPKMIRCLLR